MSDDMKNQETSPPSGVTGTIMGAIRKTSDAFANTFHLVSATGHHDQPNVSSGMSNEMAADDQQRERRMSDIEHLWESARRMNGY